METFSKLRPPEAVRIKAKLIDRQQQQPVTSMSSPKDRRISSASQISAISASSSSCCGGSNGNGGESKKFCVDPQVTSFDVLADFIAHAFAIKSEFRLSYLNRAPPTTTNMSSNPTNGAENSDPTTTNVDANLPSSTTMPSEYISLQTDWDLDAAFSSSSQPYLSLNIELVNNNNNNNISDNMDVVTAATVDHNLNHQQAAAAVVNSNAATTTNIADSISEEWEVINSSPPVSSSSSSSSSSSPSPSALPTPLLTHRMLSTPSPSETSMTKNHHPSVACSPHHQSRSHSLAVMPPSLVAEAAALAADKSFGPNSAQKTMPKSKATVIHKCVSAIHKVFNNFARSNSLSNGSPTSTGLSTLGAPDDNRTTPMVALTTRTPSMSPTHQSPHSPTNVGGVGMQNPPPAPPASPLSIGGGGAGSHHHHHYYYDPNDMLVSSSSMCSAVASMYQQKPALGELEYRNFCDSDGRIVNLGELKQRIFEGGCETSKRRELWPLLLDIYSSSHVVAPHASLDDAVMGCSSSADAAAATQRERDEFVRVKQADYVRLRCALWMRDNRDLMARSASTQCISDSSFDSTTNSNTAAVLAAAAAAAAATATSHRTSSIAPSDTNALLALAHKIHKDVCRTDRNQKFYAGESNPHVTSLFNILMTYTLAHPQTAYAQGMSDLLSPLLYVLRDEALAYVCFESLMQRCAANFCVHSDSIALKIKLLGALLARYDPELWSRLVAVGADQMLFVYRWLLLECKREFPFEDSLRVLECMWATIQYSGNINNTSGDNNTFENAMRHLQHANNGCCNSNPTGAAYLTRSNSTASSTISLRLLKDICSGNNRLINTNGPSHGGVYGFTATSNSHHHHHHQQENNNINSNNNVDYMMLGSEREDDDLGIASDNMMDESSGAAGGGSASGKSRHQSQASSNSGNSTTSNNMNDGDGLNSQAGESNINGDFKLKLCDHCMKWSSPPPSSSSCSSSKIKRTSSTIDSMSDVSSSSSSSSSSRSRSSSTSSLSRSLSSCEDGDSDDVDTDTDSLDTTTTTSSSSSSTYSSDESISDDDDEDHNDYDDDPNEFDVGERFKNSQRKRVFERATAAAALASSSSSSKAPVDKNQFGSKEKQAITAAAAASKKPKQPVVGSRFRRFSLNLSFLGGSCSGSSLAPVTKSASSSSNSKNSTTPTNMVGQSGEKVAKKATAPPISSSLTNDFDSENFFTRRRRFQLNKRIFSIIKNKKDQKKLDELKNQLVMCSSSPTSSHLHHHHKGHEQNMIETTTVGKLCLSQHAKRCSTTAAATTTPTTHHHRHRHHRRRRRHCSGMQKSQCQKQTTVNARRSKSLSDLDVAVTGVTKQELRLGLLSSQTTPTAIKTSNRSTTARSILLNKKFSLPVCMHATTKATMGGAKASSTITNEKRPTIATTTMSSSAKFSTSEAETIVMAASGSNHNANNLSSSNLRNSFCQQLSHSPTIVNTCGSQKLSQKTFLQPQPHGNRHRSTPKSKKLANGLLLMNHKTESANGEEEAPAVGLVKSTHHRHHRRHRRKRTLTVTKSKNEPLTTRTTTTGEDDDALAVGEKNKRTQTGTKKKHHHHHGHHRHRHNHSTATPSSFTHIKNSLKRSQKYLNSFYPGTMTTTTTAVAAAAIKPVSTADPTKSETTTKPPTTYNGCTCSRRASMNINPTSTTTTTTAAVATKVNNDDSSNRTRLSAGGVTANMNNPYNNNGNSLMNKSSQAATIAKTSSSSSRGNNTHFSSKSSTSAYVSTTHSLASSHSSLCSNFNQNPPMYSHGHNSNHHQHYQGTASVPIPSQGGTSTTNSSRRSSFVFKQVPIINILTTSPPAPSQATTTTTVTQQHPLEQHGHQSSELDETAMTMSEEELVYALSKLDNPFLLFMCLSMFIEHRKHIIAQTHMDANDIACYFDKMTRKHSVRPILARARALYTRLYLSKANVFSYIQQLMDIQNSP